MRPLMQNGIVELERMFESSQSDSTTLEALESELKFRSVPRAATLLNRVRRAMNGTPEIAAARQDVLFDHAVSAPARQTQLPISAPVQNGVETGKKEPAPLLTVSVDDACKILKVAANASWDLIEQSRRELVERSRPDRLKALPEDRQQALRQDALQANAALRALFQARTSR